MYEIILYDTEDGRCPVQELLDSLEPKLLAKTLRTIDLLEMNGSLLREPYSKPLESGILELRTKQGSDITRVLYFFIAQAVIIYRKNTYDYQRLQTRLNYTQETRAYEKNKCNYAVNSFVCQ